MIKSDRIFVYTPDRTKLLKGKFVASEDGRIYVVVRQSKLMPKRGPCQVHRVYHRLCGGCGVLLCPGNCTCYD